MANTEYEHAGNEDMMRQAQFDTKPRCQLCHYPVGYRLQNSEAIIFLEVVTLPEMQALFCQLCVALCRAVNDTDYSKAASVMRALPDETMAANLKLLNSLTQ